MDVLLFRPLFEYGVVYFLMSEVLTHIISGDPTVVLPLYAVKDFSVSVNDDFVVFDGESDVFKILGRTFFTVFRTFFGFSIDIFTRIGYTVTRGGCYRR